MSAIDLSTLLLPSDLLDHFSVLGVLELGDCSTKKMIYQIHLEEKNLLPKAYHQGDYESKGFYSEKRIQDFPVRGKALYLCIKRRRWRLKQDNSITIKSDYSFISEGSKLTKELSDFLKGTGRDPRRYDK
jgi:hypothetical protein